MITVFHAIQSLVPGAEVSVSIYDQAITWHQPATAPVTVEQIKQEQQRLQQAYDWNEYQRNRAREYPTIQEQLDALYHAGVFPEEMAARIRAVKTKYPRSLPDHTHPVEQTAPTMSVEAWLAQEATKTTADQLLAQQQRSAAPMTREEWLASQTAIATENNSTSIGDATVVRTMTTQEWLAEQTKMTPDQWLAQQQQSAAPMTREQWLASQVEVKTVHSATPTNMVTVTRTMTTEEWLREQASMLNSQTMTREQWLEQQKTQDQPRKLTREEWLAEQANVGN
ncbi:hypothetical protein [Haliscomenobacter sp.]|uniref:hypothetical protein n=1 Tax=Haliscomenobacter sp. TaxID=2717303 RepID=UPI003364F52E